MRLQRLLPQHARMRTSMGRAASSAAAESVTHTATLDASYVHIVQSSTSVRHENTMSWIVAEALAASTAAAHAVTLQAAGSDAGGGQKARRDAGA